MHHPSGRRILSRNRLEEHDERNYSRSPRRSRCRLLGTACGDLSEDAKPADNFLLGDALPGTNAASFAEARDAFNASENAATASARSSTNAAAAPATQNGALGGAGQQIERRYGTLTNGVFNGLASTGGSLRQLFGIGGFNAGPGRNCNSGTDNVNPRRARRSSRAA